MQTAMEAVHTWAIRLTLELSSVPTQRQMPTSVAPVVTSVIRERAEHPAVLHDDPNTERAERHGSLSHQKTHS